MVMQAAVDWANAPSTASDEQRTIVLTVLDDQDLVKSVREVGQMPFTAFAALYSVSTQPFAMTAASLHEGMLKLACTFLDRRYGCKSSAHLQTPFSAFYALYSVRACAASVSFMHSSVLCVQHVHCLNACSSHLSMLQAALIVARYV